MKISPFLKTSLLLAALTALFVTIGYAIGGTQGAYFFFIISIITNILSYWFSEQIALKMAHALPLAESEAPELYADIRDLCQQMAIPMPKVYFTHDVQANAFATGRNPQHSSICFTAGILQLLNRNEIRGVTAHELAHIKNYDVLISTIAAVVAGAISALANSVYWLGIGNREENSNPIGNLLMIIMAPIAAMLIQMAISRQREFGADYTGSKVSRDPQALAHALQKIERSVSIAPLHVNPALSSLYIANPLSKVQLMNLFSTHPPTSERIERLEEMATL